MKKLLLSCLLVFSSIITSFATGHTVTIAGTNITCNGVCNGSATATVSGGVGPFDYDWAPGSPVGDGTPTMSGVCSGTYTVTVIDNSDLSTASATIVITEPTLLTVGASGSPVCAGSCTTLSFTASGGTPSYTYSWCCGLFGPSPSVCPASSTSYTVTITDANGCVATGTTTVTVNPIPTVTVNSPTICSGDSATLTAGGAFTYIWSTGASTMPLIVNPTTTTSYTVTGSSLGCTNSAVSTVTVNPIPSAPIAGSNSPVCEGSPLNLTASPIGGATYSWTGPNSFSASIQNPTILSASSLNVGIFTVTATVAGCTSVAGTTNVVVDPTPTFTMPSTYSICSGATVLIGNSPTAGYTYNWTSSSFLSSPTISNPVCWPATTITYTLTVTDGTSGCTTVVSTTVFASGPITSGISSVNTTGCSTCDGTISAAPTGGLWPYTYSWGSATITGVCPGTYSLTITDTAGCTVTDSTTVFANNSTIANFTMVPDSTNPYNFFAFNSSTGTGNSYDWSWGDGSPNSTLASPSHTYSATGTMTVCLTASSFLCGADTLCKPVNVTGTPLSCLALFNIADDTLNPDPNAHYVYNLSFGSTLTYLWDFGDGTTSTSATPSHVYSGTGPYLLCLSVDNGAGCTDMFCDSLISADSLNRSSGIMQLMVYDVPPFQGLTTGVLDHMNEASVSVAPNPFSDVTVFEIKSSGSDVYSFELTDVLGKKVRSMNGITAKQFEISRNGLENGIYFYKIYSSESIIGVGKVIIK